MSRSGVLHVHRSMKKNNHYWKYSYHKNGKLKSIYDRSLFALEKRVKSLNLSWIVKDEELYEENISKDLEKLDGFCLLDDTVFHQL